MKQLALLGMSLSLVACQPNAEVTPVSLTSELAGTYQTNSFLDYRRLTQPAGQMPTVVIRPVDATNLTVTITSFFPKATQTLTAVTLVVRADQSLELVQAGQVIGTIQTGRIFTASGMATQGRLLQLSIPNTSFTGYRP